MIYLDNAATSFYKPKEVKMAISDSINSLTANPGRSGHKLSNKVAEEIFNTREKLKEFFHAPNHEVVFTKNCTESLNLAIRGILKPGDHVLCTIYEHNSVLRTLKYLETNGVEVTIVDCDMCEIETKLREKIRENTRLIITTHISNVTGDMCDIDSVGKLCREHNIIYLVDGAQSCGHVEINLESSNVDLFAFAGHKGCLAITGVGGLLVRNNIKLNPILFGGTGTESENLNQPKDIPEGLEAGTIPTIPIISLKAGIEFLDKNFDKIIKIEEKLSKYTYFSLKKLNFLEIYSNEASKNVFSFNIENMDASIVANELNEKYSICVRAGLHCAPLIHSKKNNMRGAIRVSLDFQNSKEEIESLCYALTKIYYANSLF